MKVLGGLLAGLGVVLVYFVYLVVCGLVLAGAAWVVLKILGVDIEGFTAVLSLV